MIRIGIWFIFLCSLCSSGLGLRGDSPDVVGWFVGSDYEEFIQIPWNYYTHIRVGNLDILPNGTATCSPDPFFQKVLSYTNDHNLSIQLGGYNINITRCSFDSGGSYCDNLYNTVQSAVKSCGPQVTGIEFDWEWGKQYINLFGYISESHVIGFSSFIDKLQVALGTPYTVSCDVDLYLLPFTRWVAGWIFQNNPNLFVNTMSYYTPYSCSISHWKSDGWVVHNEWGVPMNQINIGIGYFSTIYNLYHKIVKEPTWKYLQLECPNISNTNCICNKTPYVSPQMNYEIGQFISETGYRGVFPWAANYDSLQRPLISHLIKGLLGN